MVNKTLVLIDIITNVILYLSIVLLSLSLLLKIKIKLNLETKLVYYLNICALGLRILFTFWQYKFDDFSVTTGKQYFIFTVDSVIFVFYLNNVSRVVASWMLINQQNKFNDAKLLNTNKSIPDDLV